MTSPIETAREQMPLNQAIEIVTRRALAVEHSATTLRESRERHGYGADAKTQWHREQGDDLERQAVANDIEAAAYRALLADRATQAETIRELGEDIAALIAEKAAQAGRIGELEGGGMLALRLVSIGDDQFVSQGPAFALSRCRRAAEALEPLFSTALAAQPPQEDRVSPPEGWQPIASAPTTQEVLVYWPAMAIDDDGELTGEIADRPGHIGVSSNNLGGWEPDSVVEANGSFFDDDFEFGEPTHWMPLPAAPPLAAIQSTTGKADV